MENKRAVLSTSSTVTMGRSNFISQLTIALGILGSLTANPTESLPSPAFAFPFSDDNVKGNKPQETENSQLPSGDVLYSNGDYTYEDKTLNANNNLFFSGSPQPSKPDVAYRSLLIDMPGFDVDIPVAMWYSSLPPIGDNDGSSSFPSASPSQYRQKNPNSGRLIMDYPSLIKAPAAASSSRSGKSLATYSHRISIKRIGAMLAGMEFIPEFASKNFQLRPTLTSEGTKEATCTNSIIPEGCLGVDVVEGGMLPVPKSGPLVLLAHGFLGSRFDLSHLAEELARQGFTCLSPEYPESLAASYPSRDGLDRTAITSRILQVIQENMKITSYGIVGHSLGCGTVMSTGDDSWTRVCLAGPPVRRDGVEVNGATLVITSVNDGAVSMSRMGHMIPRDFVKLKEGTSGDSESFSFTTKSNPLPKKAALIIDRPDAPNHISFLAGSVNDSMITLLSPLLPLAQLLKIPVLDFDKYKTSRDSKQTAEVVIPLVSSFLKQNML